MAVIWEEVRQKYPSEWVLIEAIDAFSAKGKRIINQVTVVDVFGNYGNTALRQYARLHKMYPESELYIVHTKRPYLDIKVRFLDRGETS